MASVLPPTADYRPHIPRKLIADGTLSEAQLETVIYAGRAHNERLPGPIGSDGNEIPGPRRGFFVGDGTGVGKGREIAGIITDNWRQGRKKHVWVSKNKKLLDDARRDWEALGGNPDDVIDLSKAKLGTNVEASQGILYVTYDTLRTAKPDKPSRMQQIRDWIGDDFDGVIAFDEAHRMGNALDQKGARGIQKASATALSGIDLQNQVPDARVLYVSATGATDVNNLAYTERLGLWGIGTPFANKEEFVNRISKGGVAAMELVARDLKQLGLYIARGLSFRSVEQEPLEHKITSEQKEIYDLFARSWQLVLGNMNEIMKETGADKNGNARSAALSAFWSAHQRFFNTILTAMQMPTVLKQMRADVDDGNAIVVQLVNTNEAQQERAVAAQAGQEDLTKLDLTPRQILFNYVERAFPVQKYETYVDENNNERSRPAVDSEGNPIIDAEAEARRDELLMDLASLPQIDPPLEQILNEFATENVSEVTGRSRRFIRQPDGRMKEEKRGVRHNKADIDAFLNDKKSILIFSEAGGTGASYHAGREFKNQRRRMHYLVQAGWRADAAVQGFGRSHRSNQVSAPLYRLVRTDLQGHKRFISTIARRLDQLGALTKGSRQTGGQGMFSQTDNLESKMASDALRQFWFDAYADRIEDIDLRELATEMGLRVFDEKNGGLLTGNLPGITQFLNRLLSLEIDRQNQVFAAFSERFENIITKRTIEGTLDVGVETLKADSIKKVSEQDVFTDERSGAKAQYVRLKEHRRNEYIDYKKIAKRAEGFYTNKQSGKIWALINSFTETSESGIPMEFAVLQSVATSQRRTVAAAQLEAPKRWTEIAGPEAEKVWNDQIAAAPEFTTRDRHLITGVLLPIWDRLKGNPKVYRVQTDDGERFLGRVIDDEHISSVMKSLGVGVEAPKVSAGLAMARIIDDGVTYKLANDWMLRRTKVSGEDRIEIEGPANVQRKMLQDLGVIVEIHNYRAAFYIPVGSKGESTLKALLRSQPIVDEFQRGDSSLGNVGDGRRASRTIAEVDALSDDIQELAGRILGHHLENLEITHDLIGEQAYAGAFSPERRLIAVALAGSDPIGTTRHEAIHALREAGVFTRIEWALLSQLADRVWLREFQIPERYAHYREKFPGFSESELLDLFREEAVAEAYRLYHSGRITPPSRIQRLFDRVLRFIEKLANFLRGHGFTTFNDIFSAIETGEVGQRAADSGLRREADLIRAAANRDTGLASFDEDTTRYRQSRDDLFGETFTPPTELSMKQWADRSLPFTARLSARVDLALARPRRLLQDKFIDVQRTQTAIEAAKGKPIPEHLDAYMAESLYYGRAGQRLEDFRTDHVEPLIKAMSDSNLTLEEIDDYLYALHAPERNARIAEINPELAEGGSGMTDVEAAEILRDFRDNGKLEALISIEPRVREIIKQTRNRLLAAGLIDETMHDNWSEYDFYVPLRGFEDGRDASDGPSYGVGKGFDIRGREAHQALGRRSRADSPLTYTFAQAQQSIIRAEKNRVGKTFLRLVQNNPNPRLWEIDKIETKRRLNPETGLVEELYDRLHTRRDNVFAVKVGGKVHYITLHHEGLAAAMRNLGAENLGSIGKALAALNRYLSFMSTSLNPEFVISNLARDLQTAAVHLSAEDIDGIVSTVMKDVPSAIRGVYRGLRGKTDTQWSRYFREYADNGGKIGFFGLKDIEQIKGEIAREFARIEPGVWSYSRRTFAGVKEYVEHVNGAVENGVRLATYVNARKAGLTAAKAASMARELTVNFNRKGQYGALMNALYLFYNAALQGSVRMLQAVGRSRKVRGIIGTIVVSSFLIDMMNRWVADEDEDGKDLYEKIPFYEKERNLILMIPAWMSENKKSKGAYIKIPLPYGYNVFHVLGQQISAAMVGDTEPMEAAANVTKTAVNSFNPLGGVSTLMSLISPTVFDPIVEITQNKNFYGAPIKPDDKFQRLPRPESQKYFQSVNPILKDVTSFLNSVTGGSEVRPGLIDVSPEVLDYMLGFLTGGAGMFVNRTSDFVLRFARGEEWQPRQTPFARRVYGEKRRFVDRQAFYEIRDQVLLTEAEIKRFKEQRQPLEARRVRARRSGDVRMIPLIKKVDNQIRQLNRQRNKIRKSDKFSAAAKRERIDGIEKKKDALMLRARRRYYEMLGKVEPERSR